MEDKALKLIGIILLITRLRLTQEMLRSTTIGGLLILWKENMNRAKDLGFAIPFEFPDDLCTALEKEK